MKRPDKITSKLPSGSKIYEQARQILPPSALLNLRNVTFYGTLGFLVNKELQVKKEIRCHGLPWLHSCVWPPSEAAADALTARGQSLAILQVEKPPNCRQSTWKIQCSRGSSLLTWKSVCSPQLEITRHPHSRTRAWLFGAHIDIHWGASMILKHHANQPRLNWSLLSVLNVFHSILILLSP